MLCEKVFYFINLCITIYPEAINPKTNIICIFPFDNNKRTITLDGQAHQILSHISKMQNITLSEVIEQHLQSVQFELMDKESEKRYQENKKKRERDERTVDMFAKE